MGLRAWQQLLLLEIPNEVLPKEANDPDDEALKPSSFFEGFQLRREPGTEDHLDGVEGQTQKLLYESKEKQKEVHPRYLLV